MSILKIEGLEVFCILIIKKIFIRTSPFQYIYKVVKCKIKGLVLVRHIFANESVSYKNILYYSIEV